MTFEIYRSLTISGWRYFWRLKARNGEKIAVGGEGFHNLADVRNIIQTIRTGVVNSTVKEIEL